MTEGNGHVIDPNGDARRALHEAVAEHGPEALSNAVIMYNVCRDHLIGLPGESILIGSAARSDVPALLRDLIPRLGNYGAIQSAAAAVAEEHELDLAACLWVVREFARALGHIAPGPATGGSGSFPGLGPRPVTTPAPRPIPGPAPVSGAGSDENTAQVGVVPAAAGAEESRAAASAGPASDTSGGGSAEGGASRSGSAEGETSRSGSAGSETSRSEAGAGAEGQGPAGGIGPSGAAGGGSGARMANPGGTGEAGHAEGSVSGAPQGSTMASRAQGSTMASRAAEGGRAASASFASGGAGGGGQEGRGPGGSGPAGSGPAGSGPGASGPAGSGPAAGGTPWGGPGGGGAGSPGGPGLPPQGPPGAGGTPPPQGPGGTGIPPQGRPPGRSRVFTRNTLGVGAAIALVAGYLGVAAVAHLSPFPAKTVAATSSQSPGPGTSTGTSTSASPNGSPDASPDASPTSEYNILLTKIPRAVQGQNNCRNAGTEFGATAVSQCSGTRGPAAGTVLVYYLFPSPAALATGFSNLLKQANFKKSRECTTNNKFTDFLINCESGFTSTTPDVKGSIAEYTNTSNQPLIVTSDSRQNVMAVMVGTNAGDLLAYWKRLTWVVP